MKTVLLALLRLYQLAISPYLGQNCRFTPSCSEYARGAIQGHGPLRGTLLAGRRLCKCHPWHAGGFDPVPPARDDDSAETSPGNRPPARADAPAAPNLPLPLQPPAAAADTDISFRPIAD